MKFKINAGAEIDVLTKDEFAAGLKDFARDWMVEAARGPKPIRWFGSGTVSATGTLSIGGIDVDPEIGGRFGPDPNLIWSVKRWNVQGLSDGDSLSAYTNDANPGRSIIGNVTGYNRFGSDELVLWGGEKLFFTGSSLMTPAGTLITVAGSAWELPAQLTYRLM